MNEQIRIEETGKSPTVQNVAIALAGKNGNLVRLLCALGGNKLIYEGPREQVITVELVEEADGA